MQSILKSILFSEPDENEYRDQVKEEKSDATILLVHQIICSKFKKCNKKKRPGTQRCSNGRGGSRVLHERLERGSRASSEQGGCSAISVWKNMAFIVDRAIR